MERSYADVLAARREEWREARVAEASEASRRAFAKTGGALIAIMHTGKHDDPEELVFQLMGYREWLTEEAARLVALECRDSVMPAPETSRYERSMRQLRASYYAALARAARRELHATGETIATCRETIEADRARTPCVLEWTREREEEERVAL